MRAQLLKTRQAMELHHRIATQLIDRSRYVPVLVKWNDVEDPLKYCHGHGASCHWQTRTRTRIRDPEAPDAS